MRRMLSISLLMILAGCATQQVERTPAPVNVPATQAEMKTGPVVVTLDSPSPLVVMKVMVRSGYTADPAGEAGLANLVAEALIEGGFGNAADPVTKEELAEITQPWGDGAMPGAQVSGRTTTFHMTVPRDVLDRYLNEVFVPMFTQPLFQEAELDRLKNEMNAAISSIRYENLEQLGLDAIDEYVNQGTSYEHQGFGAEETIPALSRDDVVRFYRSFYRPGNMVIGVSSSDSGVIDPIVAAVRQINAGVASDVRQVDIGAPQRIKGRQAVVVEVPNAPAAGVHLGFPLNVNRSNPDFWPLYVAQTWFGTHRDSFGLLYQQIRQERGYNYGDYAYIEHWDGKPYSLFQIFNQPREQQYFSIWIRPVAPEFAYHLGKAATYELDRMVQQGLTDEQVAEGKKKAKVLYLNLAETVNRLLAAKMDDAFYGMTPGFLEGYLNQIDRVTTEQVNRAIRKHLQTGNVKFVFLTDGENADKLVAQIRENRPAYGKSLADYELQKVTLEDGLEVYQIPESKLEMLRGDAMWANYPLNIDNVRKVSVEKIFETGEFLAD